MFDIRELLILFDDFNVQKLIYDTYQLSQIQNKNLSDKFFIKLLHLKREYPSITIEIKQSENRARYYPDIDLIILTDTNEVTFLHELTHIFHNITHLEVSPQNFITFSVHFYLSIKIILKLLAF